MNLLSPVLQYLRRSEKAVLPIRYREEVPAVSHVAATGRPSWQLSPLPPSLYSRVPTTQNLLLYEQLYESIPLLPAAIDRLIQLVGCPRIDSGDQDYDTEIHEWMAGLEVNRTQKGFDNWFNGWAKGHLLYGRSHAEILPYRDYSDIWGLQTLHTRTVELKPARDGYGIDLCQRQAFGQVVILNRHLMVSAYHDVMNDDPNGTSLLWGLPFVAGIYQKLLQAMGSTFERFGVPMLHVNWESPADFNDPTGSRARAAMTSISAAVNDAMEAKAEGVSKDFVTAGKVTISIVGAEGETLEFSVPGRHVLEQVVARTGLPPMILGYQWQAGERIGAVQLAFVGEVSDMIRGHLEAPVRKIIDLHQRMTGRIRPYQLEWESPTLMDLVEEATGEKLKAEGRKVELDNIKTVKMLGGYKKVEYARALRPDLEHMSDTQILAHLPELKDPEPPMMQRPGGFGAAGQEREEERPPVGANGNGRNGRG